MISEEDKLSLPPFCKGKSSGSLKLTVDNISWNSKCISSTQKFLKVLVLWWGQKKGFEAVAQSNSKYPAVVEYQIKTSSSLFKHYLTNCDPLLFKFYSSTGSLIGLSEVKINQKLVKSGSWKNPTKIFSHEKYIGNFILSVEIYNMTVSKPLKLKYEDNTRFSVKGTISKDKILVESCERKPIAPASLPQMPDSEMHNYLRVNILSVDMNPMETIIRSEYTLKCAITSKLFWNNEEIKLQSSIFPASPDNGFQASFNQDVLQRISKIRDANAAFLNFGFSLQSAVLQSIFVGFSRLNLQEVLKAKGMLYKRCPIVSGKEIIGTVYLKAEFDDFRNKITKRNENINDQKFTVKSHPSHSNESHEVEGSFKSSKSSEGKRSAENPEKDTGSDAPMKNNENCEIDMNHQKTSLPQIFKGILFIEQLKNLKDNQENKYFITYEGFWNECQESTQSLPDTEFVYLKEFPVFPDNNFLEKVRNNHLELKLWESCMENTEKFVASTRIPLHQFYIAFRDSAMIEHLSANPLPIISIDTFTNFISPLSSLNICQAKVLLAIGNESQINHLKAVRNISNITTSTNENPREAIPTPCHNNMMKSKLSAFLESISQKMQEPDKIKPTEAPSLQLKKTSDLLDTLQMALTQRPPAPPASCCEPVSENKLDFGKTETESSSTSSLTQEKRIKIVIAIEHAAHLPKVTKKRQNRRKNKNNTSVVEHEPSVYATFDSGLESLKIDEKMLPFSVIKSHEGLVYSTKVVKSVDPNWNESFDVQLPLDMLTNPQKRFVVKVWRKCSQDCELIPAPFEDAVIGFTAVDLSVLLTGMSVLSGYYNITDFSGRCNGQIKLTFKPSENLADYQNDSPAIPHLSNPLNIDVTMTDDSTLLSRTLKRKFTELDEITQRLKARLFDVTGDENFDPDEEFERDLNTSVDEDGMNDDLIDFGWLKNDSIHFNPESSAAYNELKENITNKPSTSLDGASSTNGLPTQRMVSGCSSVNSQGVNDQLLWKKYDLDTIINPNIFMNILDPSMAQSDSTPTLITDKKPNLEDTSVSSIDSNDHVESLENALQQASISKNERKNGDGAFDS